MAICVYGKNAIYPFQYDIQEKTMADIQDLQRRLEALKRSMLEMMENGTSPKDLQKMRNEKLVPIEEAIRKLEAEMKKDPEYGTQRASSN